ncbi:MAG: hypothetical protein IJN78_01315 [Clostridia bacterium]|nr:hypothetical protein [Clostridia bacterium]
MKEKLYRIKRNLQKKFFDLHFKYHNNRYAVAFRQRYGRALYEDNSSDAPFILVKNTFRYWMADPFLVKHDGQNYLFAEMYDKKHSKGVIGYSKLNGNRCSRFRVCLKESHHLSYPCVFNRDDDIYMVPEAKDNNEIALYKAIDFPKKWKKEQIICNKPCVDSTQVSYKNENWYFTTIANDRGSDNNLFLVSETDGEAFELSTDSLTLRSAGNVISYKNQLIRPSQDDTTYGDAVILNRIDVFDVNNYTENPFKRILPPDTDAGTDGINIKLCNNRRNIQFNGLHTYNVNEDYEVIDLRYPRKKRTRN